MKKILFAVAFAIFASTQSFAIVGFGSHYLMNLGSLESGGVKTIPNDQHDITLEQKGSDGLAGIGFKIWIDFLPIIDVEMTTNIAAARYDAVLTMDGKRMPLEADLEVPFFGKARPLFAMISGDLSITYPFTMLPVIRPYLGAGISYIANTPVMDKKFVENYFNKEYPYEDEEDRNQISEEIADEFEDEGFDMGIGGHAIAGFRIKVPIIPIAFYVNGKYYFGGSADSKFSQGPVFEFGGGFAL